MNKTQKNWLLVALLLGILLEGLDGMILSTAMPRIIADLDGLKLISWVFTSYMLTSVLTTPLYGKLSDLYGRKQFYIGGMLVFMLSSVLAGQAQSIEWLIFWRGVQGIGAGAMMPVAMTIAAEIFTGADRSKIQGVLSGGFGISSVIGPTIGGWLTDGPGWRWAFYINAPLGIIVIGVLLLLKFPVSESRQARNEIHIDYFGAASLMLLTTSFLLGFVFGGDETLGWLHPQTLLCFGLTIVGLVAFLVAESRAKDPIIPLSFFKNPIFVVVNAAGFLTGVSMFGAINYISLYVQGVRGDSATDSSTAITPMMVALVVGTVVTGQLIARTGKYRMLAIAFMLIMTLGTLQLVLLDLNSATWQVLLAMITLGFGIGGTFPVFIVALQNAFDRRYLGTLNSLAGFFRQIGGTVGISIMGSILTNQLANNVSARMQANLPGPVLNGLNASGFQPNVQLLTSSHGLDMLKNSLNNPEIFNGIIKSLREALSSSLNVIFIGSLTVAILGLAVTLFLKEIPLQLGGPKLNLSEHAVAEDEPEDASRLVPAN